LKLNEFLKELREAFPELLFTDEKGILLGEESRLWDLFPSTEVIRAFEEALSTGKGFCEVKDGNRFYRLKLKRIGSLVVVLKSDVTAEREVEDLKRDIISTVSHELRTPLTVIRGNAEYLLNFTACDESHLLQEIVEKSEKIEKILSGIGKLILGKKEKFPFINLYPIVKNVVLSFKETAESKGIKLIADLEGSSVEADPLLFEQLVKNLLDNAVKFTSKGYVRVRLSKECLEVSDTGRGIGKEFLPFIFEKFVKSPDSNGRGIGLSLVREIADYHGWEVKVDSEKGRGTTFTVCFGKQGKVSGGESQQRRRV